MVFRGLYRCGCNTGCRQFNIRKYMHQRLTGKRPGVAKFESLYRQYQLPDLNFDRKLHTGIFFIVIRLPSIFGSGRKSEFNLGTFHLQLMHDDFFGQQFGDGDAGIDAGKFHISLKCRSTDN